MTFATVSMQWLTALAISIGVLWAAVAPAGAETRTLKLLNLHTREKAEVTFKRNGKYDAAGLRQANQFLRDWRKNEPTKMDPRLLDLVWEVYKASGSRDYIHVVCGYRSPGTNSMLRSRSKGVAEKSQHMLGRAMDFYLPDVKLKTLRNLGLKLQVGGVGYYPSSGSPFVHMDIGNVRHWPRMSRKELVAVFPAGKTLHVPSDGKPLPGYETALASYKSRKKGGGTALALAAVDKPSRSGGLLSSLFGGGADDEEDSKEVAAPRPKPAVASAAVASSPKQGKIRIVPPELAEPADIAPQAEEAPSEPAESLIASLPAADIPLPVFAPRPKVDVGAPTAAVADAPAAVPFPTAVEAAEAAPLSDEPAADEDMLAYDVPLPTWRPEADEAAQAPVLLAMAEAPVNAPRSITVGGEVPLPQAAAEFSVAGLPDSGPVLEAEIKDNNQRLAALSTGATPREVVVARVAGSDPVLAVGSGVKTTPKAARARAGDRKPAAKPRVLAVQPDATRWALYRGDYVAEAAGSAPAPAADAHRIVRTSPREVYATGFQHGAEIAEAGRFSGKAVSFLPVARFATN